jgi:hypothetical protein
VTGAAPGGRRVLVAGPVTLALEEGGIRYVKLGDREILRRIYVAVRDARWDTAPMVVTEQSVEAGDDAFTVSLVAEHRLGDIHYRWNGTIRGDASGTVRFEMDGEALSTFQRNRLGICTLHPIETCAGHPCRVRHADGSVVDGNLPRLIAPHQPFVGVRALSYEIEPGVVAEVRFEGDIFETEDQRNWSDHSFKTYSTPIDLPTPVTVAAGTRIQQSVEMRLVPQVIARRAATSQTRAIELSIGGEAVPLPALGTTLAPRRELLTPREQGLLAALRLSHLRVELVPSRDDFAATFSQAVATSERLGVPLELALWLTAAPAAELALFEQGVRELRPHLDIVQVLPTVREASPPALVAAVRALLPGVRIAAGTNVYFTELNRNRPAAAPGDLLVFPSCPTVHMRDETTMAENLAALTWVAQTAREIGGPRPLGLSPVSLRKPTVPPPALGSETPADLPRYVDPRQASLFAAGWTAAHLARAAEAGFARATYFQTSGWRGLMSGEAGPPLAAAVGAEPGDVFPVYHVLADVAELAGAEVLVTRSTATIEVSGLTLRLGGRTRLLVVNLSAEPQSVRLPEALAGGRLRRLGPGNVEQAMRAPDAFRAAPITETAGDTVVLAPHEIARIDSGD